MQKKLSAKHKYWLLEYYIGNVNKNMNREGAAGANPGYYP